MAAILIASSTERLHRSMVPEPPADGVRYDGSPVPYDNGGYVIDGEVDGFPVRWRFDSDGLKAFIVYQTPGNRPWRSSWFRD